MGILTKNKPATVFLTPAAPAPHSPTLDDRAGATPRDAARPPRDDHPDPTAILFAALPSPPAPCPTCHCPQRWLSRYALPPANSTTPPPATAWQCEACSPPPLPALVALRVLLVDVGAGEPFAANPPILDPIEGTPEPFQPQWHRLQVHHERDTRAAKHDPKSKPRRVVTTTPVRCAANGNLLADGAGEAGDAGEGEAGGEAGIGSGGSGGNKSSRSEGEIYFDDRLGKVFHYAEMNGAFGRDAAPTGREIYRDLDGWWADGDPRGDWERVEIEVANYEKFVKPKLGAK